MWMWRKHTIHIGSIGDNMADDFDFGFTAVDDIVVVKGATGSATVAVVVMDGHPLKSVIVQVYVPAAKLIAGLVV